MQKRLRQHLLLQIAFFILMVNNAFSQQTDSKSIIQLDNFWGIKFGSNMEQCKKMLATKQNVRDIAVRKTLIGAYIKEFAGHPAIKVALFFCNNKFCEGQVYFETPSDENEIMGLYKEIQSEIDSKYQDKCSRIDFDETNHDTPDTQLWRNGAKERLNARSLTMWLFRGTHSVGIHNNSTNMISLALTHNNELRLLYADGYLQSQDSYNKHKAKVRDY